MASNRYDRARLITKVGLIALEIYSFNVYAYI